MKNPPVEDEIAFAAIKTSLDLVAPGEKVVLNSGTLQFYVLTILSPLRAC